METGVQKRNIVVIFVCLTVLGFLICIASLGSVSAEPAGPNFYYYSSGRKIPLVLSKKMLAVRFKQGVSLEQQRAIVDSEKDLGMFSQRKELLIYELTLLTLRQGVTEENVVETISSLTTKSEVEAVFPLFGFPDPVRILTDEFIVKFNPNTSEEEIRAFNILHNVEIVRKPEWTERYTLKVKDPTNMNTLKTANLYYESPITVFSMPNFIGKFRKAQVMPDDTHFPEQWPLNNTGQTPPGGTSGADIDAPEGWEISTGSSDIVIAVLDEGVDLGHEDLVNKLLDGYDFFDMNPDPSPYQDDAHGTACAGLAAAETNNGTGVAGVCWNCKIMPIRIASSEYFYWVKEEAAANGITWAANQGADVLSNSWTWHTYSGIIHDAIKEAKNNGRNGKGCILVCAVHNYNDSVEFPATLPETIAVGATNHHDERWDLDCVGLNGCGSNYGPELDVVAPSGWALAGVISWSTDITGPAGYNPGGSEDKGDIAGNYTKWMGGTSGATPKVAGLAGLILSVNPELTSDEVQFIIEDTADDQIGDPLEDTEGWDQYYGWGRINNESALLAAGSFSIDDTLFGWWKFDEGSGQIAYDSAGDNDGELGADPHDPAWTDDPDHGCCLDFDGDDYVELNHAVDALKAGVVTISAWIKADNLTKVYYPIVSTYHNEGGDYGYLLYVKKNPYSEYKPRFYIATEIGVWVESDVSIDTSGWFHIAGTYDGFDLKIYVNGELKTEYRPGYTGYYENYDTTYIGYEDELSNPDEPPGVYFDGKIDDVRVYRRALSTFEIWDIMFPDTDRFRVKDSADETVAWFDDFGNLFLRGSLEQGRKNPPTIAYNDGFKFKNPSDANLAMIDGTNGNMYIYGEKKNWNTPSEGKDEFIIRNSDDEPVAYISEVGNLYLTGKLCENPD